MKLKPTIIAIIALCIFQCSIIFGYESLNAEQLTHIKSVIQTIAKDKNGKAVLIDLYTNLGKTKLILLGLWHQSSNDDPGDIHIGKEIDKYIDKLKKTGITPTRLAPQLYYNINSAFPEYMIDILNLKKHFSKEQFEKASLDDYKKIINDVFEDIDKIRRAIDAQGIISKKK